MARRRAAELPTGMQAFDRTLDQWLELGAPPYVYDEAAARERYVIWGREGYGRGLDPADPVLRYYVAMRWQPKCVKPLFLAHVGALHPAEDAQLLTGDDLFSRWGRLGRCRSAMLAPDADVPNWLLCCRLRVGALTFVRDVPDATAHVQ